MNFSGDSGNNQAPLESVVEHVDDILRNSTIDDVFLDNSSSFLVETNMNIFGLAILTMSKFSDQLHMEPTVEGLCLKAINNSKSAYASIFLTKEFFSDSDVSTIRKDDYNLIRISMKSALSVLRPSSAAPQRREANSKLKCMICVDPRADYMIFKIGQIYNIHKCFVIPLRDCADTYSHLFNDKSKLSNRIKLAPRILLDVLSLLGTDKDVIKFIALPDSFTVERFIGTEQDRVVKRKTAVAVDLDSLQLYSINRPTEVALCMKEFKAALLFADGGGIGVNIYFEMPERPVIVTLEQNLEFIAEFVLATFDRSSTTMLETQNMVQRSEVIEAMTRRRDFENETMPTPARNDVVGEMEVGWRTPRRDERVNVFDLDQESPMSTQRFNGRIIVCPESPSTDDVT